MANFQPAPTVTETDLGGGSYRYDPNASAANGLTDRWYFYELTRPDGTKVQSGWVRGSKKAFAIPCSQGWQEENRRRSRKREKLEIVLYSSDGKKNNQNRNGWVTEETTKATIV